MKKSSELIELVSELVGIGKENLHSDRRPNYYIEKESFQVHFWNEKRYIFALHPRKVWRSYLPSQLLHLENRYFNKVHLRFLRLIF